MKKRWWRTMRVSSAALVALIPLASVVACGGGSDEPELPKFAVPEEYKDPAYKLWAAKAETNGAVLLKREEVENVKNTKYYDLVNKTFLGVQEKAYFPIGFSLPDEITTIRKGAFNDDALYDGFTVGKSVIKVESEAFANMIEPLPSSFRFENDSVELGANAFRNTVLFEGFTAPIGTTKGVKAYDTAFMYAKLPNGLRWFDRYGELLLVDENGKLKLLQTDQYAWEAHIKTYYTGLASFKSENIWWWQGASVHKINWSSDVPFPK